VGQGEDALQAGLHPRLLSELLDELGFPGG
jgi:hypothetical protein